MMHKMGEANLNQALSERILAAAQKLELNVSRETLSSVLIYIEQLLKWNKTYNLTALKTYDDVLIQHIFDCMSILPSIQKKVGKDAFTVVDVGSGAGLPGVIIALWFPQSKVVCVDTVEKKTTFIRYVAGVMGCKNVQAKHARIEELENQNADVVISRAFASLSLFSDLSGKHCKEDGWLVSMKSALVNEDILELKTTSLTWTVEALEELHVPEMKASRYLVWLQRNDRND